MDEPIKSKYQDYRCPACEGIIKFANPENGKLDCPHCHETVEINPGEALEPIRMRKAIDPTVLNLSKPSDNKENHEDLAQKEEARKQFLAELKILLWVAAGFLVYIFVCAHFDEIAKTILSLFQMFLFGYALFKLGVL